ncbi:alpha/beta hydrolase [Oceanicola sp. S124]|uniref:alpha/beta hydrolase n=1 Tax=Oceanicola sp. S124 TaxID=1042378 RepID=UPI00025584EE|nr:alpha/beta hydrolase [Oceanicola sp. S124]
MADQKFLFSTRAWSSAEAPDQSDPIDMDIVANTYRSIVDETAFEAMIDNWCDKLDQADARRDPQPRISRQLLSQLALARHTLETLEIPAENDPLKREMAAVPGPAIVLSPEGRVAASNVEGGRAFGVQQGTFFDQSVLGPESLQDYKQLRQAANGRGNAAQAILTVYPAGTHGYARPFLAEGYTLHLPGQTGDFIVIRSLEVAWSDTVATRLQQAFGLSGAEAEVARLFFQLRDIDRISHERGVSVFTTRTQIKAIQAKTGAPSNIDLMRLLFMVASRELLGRRGETPVWQDPLGREQQITGPDGRVVAFTWMGDEAGLPVVALRGFPMTYLLPGEGEARLKAAGIKLYALSRPGYGNSSLHQDQEVLADNLTALRLFLDRQIDRPCVGVGMSNGFVPLLAEQDARPERFRALIAIGYTGVLDRSGIHRLQPVQRTMMRLAGPAPWLAELMAKSGHRMMRQHGVDWYLSRAYRGRALDMQSCQDPDVAALIRNACEHLLKQGHAAFVRDLQLACAPVDPMIERLRVPLRFLAPTEDGVFDETAYRRLESRSPLARVDPVPGAGELIFYQQTDLILDRIIAAATAPAGAF